MYTDVCFCHNRNSLHFITCVVSWSQTIPNLCLKCYYMQWESFNKHSLKKKQNNKHVPSIYVTSKQFSLVHITLNVVLCFTLFLLPAIQINKGIFPFQNAYLINRLHELNSALTELKIPPIEENP